MEDTELYEEILWVLQNYGSDAGERADPGSKVKAQAARIVMFVEQRELAHELLRTHGIDLLRVTRR